MTLSQLHRSQHTLFGISQHSRHVTWETGSKGFPATGLKRKLRNKSGNTRPKGGNRRNKGGNTRTKIWPKFVRFEGSIWSGSVSTEMGQEDTIALFTPDYTFAWKSTFFASKSADYKKSKVGFSRYGYVYVQAFLFDDWTHWLIYAIWYDPITSGLKALPRYFTLKTTCPSSFRPWSFLHLSWSSEYWRD